MAGPARPRRLVQGDWRVCWRGVRAVSAAIHRLHSIRLRSHSPDCPLCRNHYRTQSPDGPGTDTIGDKARRFVHEGMLGLVDQRAGSRPQRPSLPEASRRIHALREQPIPHRCPRTRAHRAAEIRLQNQSPHRQSLSGPPCEPGPAQMPLLAFAEFADAYHARWTVVRLWAEGWNKQSIAGCLKMARSHAYAIIAAS